MTDTPPEVMQRYRAMLLARSPADRLKMACSMSATARALVRASVLAQDPHTSPAALRRALFLRFYGHEFDAWYRELLETVSGRNGAPSAKSGSAGLADYVAELAIKAGLAQRLSEVGVDRERLPQLAVDAAKQWTGTFNPRPFDAASALSLYESAY